MPDKTFKKAPPPDATLAVAPASPGRALAPAALAELRGNVATAARLFAKRRSKNTLLAYARDWAMFAAWCERTGLPALPTTDQVVVAYIGALADGTAHPAPDGAPAPRRPATIKRRLASIAVKHAERGLPSPTGTELVAGTWEGLCREVPTAPNKRRPALAELVRLMLVECPPTRVGRRDAALLATGFGIAARQSEVVGLDREHLEFVPEGLRVFIAKSKTDQRGRGAWVRVPRGDDPRTCPVALLRAWLAEADALGAREGAVFRSLSRRNFLARLDPDAVATAVKQAVARVARARPELALDARGYAGHSLRSGHITSAARGGKRLDQIRATSRHELVDSLMGYIDGEGSWDELSGKGLL